MAHVHWRLLGIATILTVTYLEPAIAREPDYVQRDFVVDAALLSYLPNEGIKGYEHHGAGMTTARASLGLGLKVDDVSVSVEIAPRMEQGRFLATVDLEPEEAKRNLGFKKQELDLTEVKPLSVPLATSEKGRVYQLNLSPSVRVIDSTPRRLEVKELRLHNWRFPDSPVLVNDALYVGRISCSQSPIAFVDISGVAKIEFSLHQLVESKPWGVLKNGVVTLTNPDDRTTVQISNVRNGGPHAVELPGGPYQVWVRWSEPTYSVEQHRKVMLKIRERIVSGEIPNARTDYIDKQIARDPSPWLCSSGVRGLRRGELAP